jgi:hypothetical protein
MKLKVITQRRLPAVCREPSALSLILGAQYLGEEVGHVGRLELIRRHVHDAAGDRRDLSAHPQVAPAIGRHRDYARPPEEPPLIDDDRFVLRGEPVRRQEGGCGARRASGGERPRPRPRLSQVRPSRSSRSKT